MRFLFFLIINFFFLFNISFSQQLSKIYGSIKDEDNNPLIGINIYNKENKTLGTVTNSEGEFEIEFLFEEPASFIISGIGYEQNMIFVDKPGEFEYNFILDESILFGNEVVVSASLYEQNILSSPVSIEKLDILDLEQSSAANFFDELSNIKGIDMIVQSLSMRFPNSRGFNGNTNYRLNQLVDGVNNSSPGLSFSPGNIFGVTQLDLESLELLVGASSALYGPGGMNGTLIMTSKNPFDYQGLSISLQGGIMHLSNNYEKKITPMQDFNFRYAKKFNEKFAFKVKGGYLRADDWNASDYRNKRYLNNENLDRWYDPGYDGVNVYGDEVSINMEDIEDAVAKGFAENLGQVEGTSEYEESVNMIKSIVPNQDLTRTGWNEKDLVSYDAKNIRIGTSFHYKINPKTLAILQGDYASGTSVYSAQNRFELNNFSIITYKAELKGDNYLFRLSGANENSGNTYDAGTLGIQMNESWKSSELWFQDYFTGFLTGVLGFKLNNEDAHIFARQSADNIDKNGNVLDVSKPFLLQPGSKEFLETKQSLINKSIADGGASVIDKSSMYNFDFNYDFKNQIQNFKLLFGANIKYTVINSEGSIFYDKPGDPLEVYEIGSFLQFTDEWFGKRFFPNFSIRFDKNQYFKPRLTPRFSFVYATDETNEKFLRVSAQTAFRFPSVVDQWTDLYVAPVYVVGGQSVLQDIYNLRNSNIYPLDGNNPVLSKPILTDLFEIPEFGPERVIAYEIGYKGLYSNKRMMIDAYAFYNNYNGFLASQLLAQNPGTAEEKRFQTTVSLQQPVNSYGWALGIDYNFKNNFNLSSNVSYNDVDEVSDPGFQIQFNTPDYRFNIGIGNRKIVKNLGFNINYRWQNSFLWESSFGVGEIPSINNLDAQINLFLPKYKTKMKLGCSNILNKYYTTSFGSANVGSLIYLTIIADNIL